MAQQYSNFYCDISADVRAEKIEFDYGVDRSPRGRDYINHEVNTVKFWIAGVAIDVDLEDLPDNLREAIEREAIDNCYSDEWVV